MGCTCNKNKPKVNPGPARGPVILSRATPPPPTRVDNVQMQQVPPAVQAQQTNIDPTIAKNGVSPSGMDAHKRRIDALRRNAIRRTFGA